jgi:hypothetical protein
MRQQMSDPGERIVSSEGALTGRRKRYWFWLVRAITGLWVALLLSIIAYALVEGEAVLAQLDRLDLFAPYSSFP